MIVGFQVILIGLVEDAIASNRRLTEELLFRVRSIELSTLAEEITDRDHHQRTGRDREAVGVRGGCAIFDVRRHPRL